MAKEFFVVLSFYSHCIFKDQIEKSIHWKYCTLYQYYYILLPRELLYMGGVGS